MSNKAGGIIAGRDVSLMAVNGDVINGRTATAHESGDGYYNQQRNFVDNAARVEAAKTLTISAGRDVNDSGSVLQSGGDTSINAGRDINITSTESSIKAAYGSQRNSGSITQNSASVSAGRDLNMIAGRDLTAIASQIDAKRNIAMAATENLTLASAADEQHSYSKTKKVTSQEDHVSQVSTNLTAGGSVVLSAGKDMTLISSRVSAGDEAYLVAGNNIELLAAQDSDYSLYDMKKKGSWGSKKTQRDEVTQVTNVGSEIKTGGDLTLQSGGDQRYQVAKLGSGNDLTLASGGSITFEAVKDMHQESHEKSSSDLAWNSSKGKGATDETLRQSEIVAQGKLAIHAVNGLNVDIKHLDQHTISQTIDVMVKADPQLAWLKAAEQRGDVNWRQVQEMHESFKYSHSSLGQGAMLAIIIVVTALTAGAASGALGTMAGASAGSGSAMAAAGSTAMVQAGTAVGTAAAGWGNVMVSTAVGSMAGTAAASTINNKGNLGKVVKDVTSEESLKGYATSAAIAGFGAAYTDGWGRELTAEGNYKVVDLGERLQAYAANTALKGVLSGNDKDTWMSIAAASALMELYLYSVGREPDVRQGVDRPDGPRAIPLSDGSVPNTYANGLYREGKNIGLNWPSFDACQAIYSVCHGTPVSDALNNAPGFNSFATLHDTWMNKLELFKGEEMSGFENLGSMPPALFVNYMALYDKYRPAIKAVKKNEAR